MTRVMFIGEMFYPDLSIGGGPVYPSGPVDPGYSPPWARPQPPVISGGPGWLPRPPGPVDPGYSPPWATPGPGGPIDPGYSPPWAQPPGGPVDPGYSPPWAQAPGGGGGSPPGIWGGGAHPMPPIYIPGVPSVPAEPGGPVDPGYFPPGVIIPAPGDPNKIHLVAYGYDAQGKPQRVTFTVDKPVYPPPTEATPKV